MRQKLVRFFGRCIKRNGIIHLVISGIRHLFIRAIHAGAESVNKMLHAARTVVVGMTAGFQNVVKANQVTFNICIRIGDRIGTPACAARFTTMLGLLSAKILSISALSARFPLINPHSKSACSAAHLSSCCRRYSLMDTS